MSNNKIAIAMKTNYFQIKNLSIYSVLGMIGLLAASCGSYQSASYNDRDGIYGSNDKGNAQTEPTTRKDYFSAYKTDENTEVFTDVENYNTTYAETPTAVAQEQSATNYGGWGDNTENVTVNVYGGNWPYWGWNNYWYGSYWGWGWNSWIGPSWTIGWGWGYPYYGYYGYGYPYYGYGWNNYYYGNGYHNHYSNHSYAYNSGRRNYNYNGGRGRNYSTGTRSYTGTRNNSYTTGGTRTYSAPRSSSPTRSEASQPRQNNNTYSAPRSSSPTRSYTPSSGGTRSSGGGSYGGGSYGGGGGGSRGGGRR